MQKTLIYTACAVVIGCGGLFAWQSFEAYQAKEAAAEKAWQTQVCDGALVAFMNDRYVGRPGDRNAVERCVMDGHLTEARIRQKTADFVPLPNWRPEQPRG